MKPLISIIIPSYNQGHFIKETIDSILNQSYKNVEILVIDGGSADNTIEVLNTYGKEIYWISEKDRGQTHAINKGIKIAKGDIITYLNSDDYFLNDTVQLMVNAFNENSSYNWITGDYIIIDENGKNLQSIIVAYKKMLRKFISFNLLSILNPIIQPGTFLKRTFLEEIGLFNEDLKYTMDYDYWMRCIQKKRPLVLTNKLSAFRIHKHSKGGSQYTQQFKEELMVSKHYQKNKIFHILHFIHNQLILLNYRILK